MMRKLGFREDWIVRVMKCVTSVNYRIKVNNSLSDTIIPQRGLRQGDPLSPYLFLICGEAFSCLLNKAEEDGRLQGVSVCASTPSFNHLLFVDDSLILLKVNEENSAHLQNILSLYEDCSGQTVNFSKSTVMFSPNTPRRERKKVMDMLHIETEARNEKYLGLPVYVARSKKGAFAYLKGRMWGKIQGWDEKMMSRAAKDVLIKACAQAIPTFAMSCFDITKCLCDEMSVMICRFWWAQQKDEKKVHWISWKKMTQSKKDGGLGFRDLHLFNHAMLAR
jgi:hypothetical protein